MAKPIHQEILFKSGAQRVFTTITDANEFGELTQAPAEIDARPGGEFSCFGGMITGRNIELLAPKLLVQAWRVANWDAGVYSIARFELEQIDSEQTRLIFDHSGFPEEQRKHLKQGWQERYWGPIKAYLEARAGII